MTDLLQEAVDSGYAAQLEAKARSAAENLLKGQQWEDWLVFGEYLAMGRNECMLRAGTNDPIGAKYNRAMNGWLTDRPWVCDIDKVSRSHAVWCWDNRDALAKLRDNMGSERQKKNHPTVMKRAYDAAQRASEKAAPKKEGTTSKAELEQQLMLLSDERDKWKQKAESADMLFDLKSDNVKVIVGVIASEVSMNKLRELANALKAEFERRSKIKNGKATS
jgi:hypothetical protein